MVIGAALPRGIAAAALAAVAWTSCASPQTAGGANAACYRIEDCQEGFACIKGKCSKNLSSIQGTSPMAVGGQGGAGGAKGRDAAPDSPAAPAEGGPGGGMPAAGGAPANGGGPGDAGPG